MYLYFNLNVETWQRMFKADTFWIYCLLYQLLKPFIFWCNCIAMWNTLVIQHFERWYKLEVFWKRLFYDITHFTVFYIIVFCRKFGFIIHSVSKEGMFCFTRTMGQLGLPPSFGHSLMTKYGCYSAVCISSQVVASNSWHGILLTSLLARNSI